MDRDCRQFAAWCPKQLQNVIFIAGATVKVRNVSLRDWRHTWYAARDEGPTNWGIWGVTPDGGAGRIPCAEVRNLEGVPGRLSCRSTGGCMSSMGSNPSRSPLLAPMWHATPIHGHPLGMVSAPLQGGYTPNNTKPVIFRHVL